MSTPLQTPPEHFIEYATERLRRSGVTVDETYTFVLDPTYQKERHLIVKPGPPHIRFYVQGDERTFWVFERANLWPADTKVERLVIPVQFREHKTKDGKDYSYYEVDKLVI